MPAPLPWEGAGQAHSSLGPLTSAPTRPRAPRGLDRVSSPAGSEHRDTAAEPERVTTGGDCRGQPGQPHALRPPTSPFPLCSQCPASPWMPPMTGCSAPRKAAVSPLWLFPPGVGSRLEQGTGANRARGGAHSPARGPRHFSASTTPVHTCRCLFTGRRWTHR